MAKAQRDNEHLIRSAQCTVVTLTKEGKQHVLLYLYIYIYQQAFSIAKAVFQLFQPRVQIQSLTESKEVSTSTVEASTVYVDLIS